MMNSIRVGIEGMTCANCVNRVERTLGKTEGVADANVNLATERATVRYDPTVTTPKALLDAVEAAGFEPGLADRLQRSLAETAQRQEMANQPAVLLTAPQLRGWLSRLTRHSVQGLNVLSYNEITDEKQVKIVASIGQQQVAQGSQGG
jgi:flagellar biosynthesis protein FlhA